MKLLTKSILFASVVLITGFSTLKKSAYPVSINQSKPFKLVFQQYAFKEDGKDWEEWKTGQNIFIINYNSNGDILHYLSGGSKRLYTMRNGWAKSKKTNEEYSMATFITDEGEEIFIQVYYEPRTFLKIVSLNKYMIQFDYAQN